MIFSISYLPGRSSKIKKRAMVLGSERDGLKYFNSRLSISAHDGCDEDIEGMRGAGRSIVSAIRKRLYEKIWDDKMELPPSNRTRL